MSLVPVDSVAMPERVLTPEQILDATRALLPEIATRADEIAGLRRLPLDLVAKLKAAGLFRMSMPRAWGGPEMTPRQQYDIYELLGGADASVAWCVKIGSDSGYFAAMLEESAARVLFADLDSVVAGQAPPNGMAERAPGGYRVSGRWTFGSGSTHADVMVGGCLVSEQGRPVMTPFGPLQRMILAPASSFTIVDTWFSTGLAGSGSNDYIAADLFVPDAHTFALDEPPRRREALYCYPAMFLASWHGLAVGLARRAIDAALTVMEKRMHAFPPPPMPLRQRPFARVALAKAEMEWRAARAFSCESIDRIWEEARTRGAVEPETRRVMMQSLQFAFRTARSVAQAMYDVAGPAAVYATRTPLDRLLRDAITMSEHLLLGDSFLEIVGGVMVGERSPIGWL